MLNGKTRGVAVRVGCACALSIALLGAAWAQPSTAPSGSAANPTPAPPSDMHASSGPSHEMHRRMMDSMKDMQGMTPSGDLDRDFATMMRRHHQSGIEMARQEIAHGKDPKMKEMARKILASQQKESREFEQWLARRDASGGTRAPDKR